MKRILITGKNSYIGTSFENWLNKSEGKYQITSLDMHGDAWKQHDFSHYDVVFHVAGIAHVSSNPSKDEEALYYRVNRDLAIDTAKKAKAEGVNQFIFMSSIIVYGDVKETNGRITKDTIPNPENAYGDSKLQAEKGIMPLQSEKFNVVILRPPMIYGPNSKGNYQKLVKFAKISPIFPNYPNKRSMLFIDNLSEFLKQIMDNNEKGLFFPQNEEYVCTSQMVKEIAEVNKKRIYLTKLFNPFITLLKNVNVISKLFGTLIIDKNLSETQTLVTRRNLEMREEKK